jgi:hypothetical protein
MNKPGVHTSQLSQSPFFSHGFGSADDPNLKHWGKVCLCKTKHASVQKGTHCDFILLFRHQYLPIEAGMISGAPTSWEEASYK